MKFSPRPLNMEVVHKVRNPETGRPITVGGQVYNNLIARGYRLVHGQLVRGAGTPLTIPPLPQPVVPVEVPPQIISQPIGTIPAPPQTISQELAQVIREEQRTCKLCQQYYINRYTKFTPAELKNLQIINQLCSRCADLCGQRYARAGLPPGPECAPYTNASRQSQQQAAALDSQIRSQAIRTGGAVGANVNQFFPPIPQ